jgi:negative regulator of replication initiation
MVDSFEAMTLAAHRRLPLAAALCLSLTAAGCQRGDLTQQTKKTEARICTELTTVNQALEQVAALTPTSTVGEAKAAQQKLGQSIAALQTTENQLQKLRVEAFRKVLEGFRGEVAAASANKTQTLEQAANELKPKALAVIAARKALSAAVQCEEPAAAAPSKP